MSANPSLQCLGAARQVTGSCHLIRLGRTQVLLDCGMVQGANPIRDWHRFRFRFRPERIDLVVLSHAHIDHSGLLPLLVAQGFRGKILCTPGTRALLPVLLKDSVLLYQKDLEWHNRRLRRQGKPPLPTVMTTHDVDQVMKQVETLSYDKQGYPTPGVELVFRDAGHILGSAIVELWLKHGQSMRHLVFSGDLGNPSTVLMHDPARIESADLVLMEGTYGNRDHRPFAETYDELASILARAHADGGNVYIPSFALGRTQELLYCLGELFHQGRLKQNRVFLDSPMAASITDIYDDALMRLDKKDVRVMTQQHAGSLEAFLPILRITESVEDSIAINRISGGAIVIAGSGMCNGGRITHHLKHNLWNASNHLVFVGFQARGTLGRHLVDGDKHVKLFGQSFAVKAQVHTLGGFSAHAGRSQLIDWARRIGGSPRFYLVHGEPDALEALRDGLAGEGLSAEIPEPREKIDL